MLRYRFLICIILYSISKKFLYVQMNIDTYHYILYKLEIEEKIRIRSEDISITSPEVLGSIGGGIFVIIVLIIIVCCYCRKSKNTPIETPVVLEIPDQIDLSVDQSKEKLSKKNSITNSKLMQKDASTIEKPNTIVEDNTIVVDIIKPDSFTDRKLINTRIENKEQRIIKLFQNFVTKVNLKDNNDDHDRNDFFKPPSKTKNYTNNDAVSCMSKFSANPNFMPIEDMIRYTNEKRDSPTNSFYDKKMDEIYHIQQLELELEDDNKTQKKQSEKKTEKIEETKIEIKLDNQVKVVESQEKLESFEDGIDKNSLVPYAEDVISYYKEKKKNFVFELYKKSTLDFEIESLERKKSKNNNDEELSEEKKKVIISIIQ